MKHQAHVPRYSAARRNTNSTPLRLVCYLPGITIAPGIPHTLRGTPTGPQDHYARLALQLAHPRHTHYHTRQAADPQKHHAPIYVVGSHVPRIKVDFITKLDRPDSTTTKIYLHAGKQKHLLCIHASNAHAHTNHTKHNFAAYTERACRTLWLLSGVEDATKVPNNENMAAFACRDMKHMRIRRRTQHTRQNP